MARLALLAVVALLVAAECANAAERRVPRGWLGVHTHAQGDRVSRDEWRRMARAGVETVRVSFMWSRLQPVPPWSSGGSFDFDWTDALAVAAARHGIRLLPVVEAPPNWVAVEPGQFGSPPADPGATRRMFAALAERYGPRGSLWRKRPRLPRVPIRAWQVFNEPNLERFWTVQPFAAGYVATLRAAERGIHSADPGATVVLGGLTNRSWEALEAIYAAGGRGAFDAVAIHPYTSTPEKIVRIIRYARRVMRLHGDRTLPVWVTEFSWPATSGTPNEGRWVSIFGPPITDSAQARLLSRTIRAFVAARERLGIARLMWFTWLSREDAATNDAFAYAGLRRVRGGVERNTPALRAFRRWARRLEGCAKAANAEQCR